MCNNKYVHAPIFSGVVFYYLLLVSGTWKIDFRSELPKCFSSKIKACLFKRETVFRFQNWSDQLWENYVRVVFEIFFLNLRLRVENLHKFWDHKINLGQYNFWNIMFFILFLELFRRWCIRKIRIQIGKK